VFSSTFGFGLLVLISRDADPEICHFQIIANACGCFACDELSRDAR